MSDKNEIVNNLAGALVAIFVGCLVVICIIVNLPNTKELDGALIANVLVGGVTLFAPIAAYYLLNDWKEQYNISLEKDDLKSFKIQLKKLRENIDYYEVHYRGVHSLLIPINENDNPHNINSFSELISDYDLVVKEIQKKRRELSFIAISYEQDLKYYMKITPDFVLETEFEKINCFVEEIDKFFEYIKDNDLKSFFLTYDEFSNSYDFLNEMLENQMIDLDQKLRV
ncbi:MULTISPECIES: hypothetical protein [Acinetobacter]|uniref:hypothetical protein n=1 Tax=Acinetobacter TaxID=469 RepID=UPI0002AECF31|nr:MULTISPECIES: hypothetical protein [Acinetobacter]ELW77033.1 hypothetical protein ACINWC743_A0620 [Acinetobacter sp. WC-743]MBJ8428135.1 hypothetical protein [Acinetobacter bereziniae]